MKKLFILFLFLWCGIAFAGPQTTSTTTGTNLIAKARVYLDEPSTDIIKWTEAQLLQFLNDGTSDIAARTHCYQGTESINLIADTVEYTPSSSYIAVIAVVLNRASEESIGLVKGNVSSVGRAVVNGSEPRYWYEFGGKVGIYPSFSAVTTETATVYFAKLPAAIAAGGNVPTPAVFDKALVYYITAQALLRDRRFSEAANFLTLYQIEIDRYRMDFVEADNETVDPIK